MNKAFIISMIFVALIIAIGVIKQRPDGFSGLFDQKPATDNAEAQKRLNGEL